MPEARHWLALLKASLVHRILSFQPCATVSDSITVVYLLKYLRQLRKPNMATKIDIAPNHRNELVLARLMDATPEQLFKIWTTPERYPAGRLTAVQDS